MYIFFCTLSLSNLQYLTTAVHISSAPEPLIQKVVNMEPTVMSKGEAVKGGMEQCFGWVPKVGWPSTG